ncbi:MAG: hypothetical protein IKD44_00530, partial [Lentisphaeria bacterium]|nr:hypothetical protein [Lentisphaeria bacterium]
MEKDHNTRTWQIDTLEELKAFRDEVNAGTTFAGWTVTLGGDIDLSGENWLPIGDVSNNFKGTFDGNDCTITGLTVNNTNGNYAGLFGYLDSATVKDLTLEDVTINGKNYVGAVAGYTNADYGICCIENVTVTGTVIISGGAAVGGIVGGGNAALNDVTVAAGEGSSITGTSGDIGGIIGKAVADGKEYDDGEYQYSGLTSNISVAGSSVAVNSVGGVIGSAGDGVIVNGVTCTASAVGVVGIGEAKKDNVGGIVGAAGEEVVLQGVSAQAGIIRGTYTMDSDSTVVTNDKVDDNIFAGDREHPITVESAIDLEIENDIELANIVLSAPNLIVDEGMTLTLVNAETAFENLNVNGSIKLTAIESTISGVDLTLGEKALITIDAAGFETGFLKVIDLDDPDGSFKGNEQIVFENMGELNVYYGADGDICITDADFSEVFLTTDAEGKEFGEPVVDGAYAGVNAFAADNIAGALDFFKEFGCETFRIKGRYACTEWTFGAFDSKVSFVKQSEDQTEDAFLFFKNVYDTIAVTGELTISEGVELRFNTSPFVFGSEEGTAQVNLDGVLSVYGAELVDVNIAMSENAVFNSTAAVNVIGDNVVITGGAFNAAAIEIAGEGVLDIDGAAITADTIANNGRIDVIGDTDSINAGINGGILAIQNGALFTSAADVKVKLIYVGYDYAAGADSDASGLVIAEGTSVEGTDAIYVRTGSSMTVNGTVSAGEYNLKGNVTVAAEADMIVAGTQGVKVREEGATLTVYGDMIWGNIPGEIPDGRLLIEKGSVVIDGGTLYEADDAADAVLSSVVLEAEGTLTLSNGAAVTLDAVVNAGAIFMDETVKITANTLESTGSITVDAEGFTGIAKIFDLSSDAATPEDLITFENLAEGVDVFYGDDGDVTLSDVSRKVFYVDSTFSGAFADEVAPGKYFGINAFGDMKSAMAALVYDETEIFIAPGCTVTGENGIFEGWGNDAGEVALYDIDGKSVTWTAEAPVTLEVAARHVVLHGEGTLNIAENVTIDYLQATGAGLGESLFAVGSFWTGDDSTAKATVNLAGKIIAGDVALSADNGSVKVRHGNLFVSETGSIDADYSIRVRDGLLDVTGSGKDAVEAQLKSQRLEINGNPEGEAKAVIRDSYVSITYGGGKIADRFDSNTDGYGYAKSFEFTDSRVEAGSLVINDAVTTFEGEGSDFTFGTVSNAGTITLTGSTLTVSKTLSIAEEAAFTVSGESTLDIADFTEGVISVTDGTTLTDSAVAGAGTLIFAGTVEFEGANTITSAVNSPEEGFDLVVNQGASLLITRFVVGYDRSFTVYGEIEDASLLTSLDDVTLSLKANSTSGFSVGGTGTGNMTVQDAYVDLGSTSWKNAYGTYEWSFTNSYIKAASLGNANVRASEDAVWNLTFTDSVLEANYIKSAVGVNFVFEGGSYAEVNSIVVEGSLTIDATSDVLVKGYQNNTKGGLDEHGDIQGTVNVEGSLTIDSTTNVGVELYGAEVNVTGGTLELNKQDMTLDAEAALEISEGGQVNTEGVVTNSGTINVSGGSFSAGAVDNSAGVIGVSGDSQLNIASFDGNAIVAADGATLTDSTIKGAETYAGVENSGYKYLLSVNGDEAGTLNLAGSNTITSIDAGAGDTVNVTGTLSFGSNGSDGFKLGNGATWNIENAEIKDVWALSLDGAYMTDDDNAPVSNMTFTNSTLIANQISAKGVKEGQEIGYGTFNVEFKNSTVDLSGKVQTQAQDTADVNISFSEATSVTAKDLLNDSTRGTITFDGTDEVNFSRVFRNKGTVEILNGAEVNAVNTYDTTEHYSANEGTINVNGAALNLTGASTFANSGTIALENASFSAGAVNTAEGTFTVAGEDNTLNIGTLTGTLLAKDGAGITDSNVGGTVEAEKDLSFAGDNVVKTLNAVNGGTITVEEDKTLALNNFSFGSSATAGNKYIIDGGMITANYGFFQHGVYTLNADFETGYMYYSYGSDITVNGSFHSRGEGDGLDYVRGNLTVAEGGSSTHDKALWVGQPASWGEMAASLTVAGYVQAATLNVYAGSTMTVNGEGEVSAGTFNLTGTLTINAGEEFDGIRKVVDVTGNSFNYGENSITVNGEAKLAIADDGDIFIHNADMTTFYVDTDYTGEFGTEVAEDQYLGINAFDSFAAALDSKADETVKFVVNSDTDSALSGKTITGTVVTGAEDGVTIADSADNDYVSFANAEIGENITVDAKYIYLSGENKFACDVNCATTFYSSGKLTLTGNAEVYTTMSRYYAKADDGIYVVGTAEAGKGAEAEVQFKAINYLGHYSGTFSVKDTAAEFGYILLNGSNDGDIQARLVLDNARVSTIGGPNTQPGQVQMNDDAAIIATNNSLLDFVGPKDFAYLSMGENNSISLTDSEMRLGKEGQGSNNINGTITMASSTLSSLGTINVGATGSITTAASEKGGINEITAVKIDNQGTINVGGETTMNIGTLTGNAVNLLEGATLFDSVLGGMSEVVINGSGTVRNSEIYAISGMEGADGNVTLNIVDTEASQIIGTGWTPENVLNGDLTVNVSGTECSIMTAGSRTYNGAVEFNITDNSNVAQLAIGLSASFTDVAVKVDNSSVGVISAGYAIQIADEYKVDLNNAQIGSFEFLNGVIADEITIAGTTAIEGALFGADLISVAEDSIISAASIDIGEGARMTVSSGAQVTTATVTNNGELAITGSTLTADEVSGSGSFTIGAGATELNVGALKQDIYANQNSSEAITLTGDIGATSNAIRIYGDAELSGFGVNAGYTGRLVSGTGRVNVYGDTVIGDNTVMNLNAFQTTHSGVIEAGSVINTANFNAYDMGAADDGTVVDAKFVIEGTVNAVSFIVTNDRYSSNGNDELIVAKDGVVTATYMSGNGRFSLQTGAVTVYGSVTGDLSAGGGQSNIGSTSKRADGEVYAMTVTVDGGQFAVTGSQKLVIYDGSALEVTNNGTFSWESTVDNSGTINISGDGAAVTGKLTNSGEIEVSGKSFAATTIDNSGTITVKSNGFTVGATENSGNICVADGGSAVFEVISNSGTITIDTESTLTAGDITGKGSVIIDAADFQGGVSRIVDLSGDDSIEEMVTGENLGENSLFYGADGDVFITDQKRDTLYVGSVYAGADFGAVVNGNVVGYNAFDDIADAVNSAKSDSEVGIVKVEEGNSVELYNWAVGSSITTENADGLLIDLGNNGQSWHWGDIDMATGEAPAEGQTYSQISNSLADFTIGKNVTVIADAMLGVGPGSCKIEGAVEVNALFMQGTALVINGSVTVADWLTLSSNGIATDYLQVNETGVLTAAKADIADGFKFTVDGSVDLDYVERDGTFNIGKTGTLELSEGEIVSIVNDGELNFANGGELLITGSILSSGTLTVGAENTLSAAADSEIVVNSLMTVEGAVDGAEATFKLGGILEIDGFDKGVEREVTVTLFAIDENGVIAENGEKIICTIGENEESVTFSTSDFTNGQYYTVIVDGPGAFRTETNVIENGKLVIAGGSVALESLSLGSGNSVEIAEGSTVSFSGLDNKGTISVDLADCDIDIVKIFDYTGSNTMDEDAYGNISVNNDAYTLAVIGNDLFACTAEFSTTDVVVCSQWANSGYLDVVGEGLVLGLNAFSTIDDNDPAKEGLTSLTIVDSVLDFTQHFTDASLDIAVNNSVLTGDFQVTGADMIVDETSTVESITANDGLRITGAGTVKNISGNGTLDLSGVSFERIEGFDTVNLTDAVIEESGAITMSDGYDILNISGSLSIAGDISFKKGLYDQFNLSEDAAVSANAITGSGVVVISIDLGAAYDGSAAITVAQDGIFGSAELVINLDVVGAELGTTNMLVEGITDFKGTIVIDGEELALGGIYAGADYEYELVLNDKGLALEQTTPVEPEIRQVRSDVDGNGYSDIVLHHTKQDYSGAWLTQKDGSVIWGNLSDSDAELLGIGKMDDTKALFYLDEGSVGYWKLENGSVTGYETVTSVDDATNVIGLGDFNGDGSTDLLLRNDNGMVGAFMSDGTGWTEFQSLGAEWNVAGVGDLNNDGIDDVILHHTIKGFSGAWLINEPTGNS